MIHFEKNLDTQEQMPREKMMAYGPKALKPEELLAILLRVGERHNGEKISVSQLSRRLIADGGFKGMFTQDDISSMIATYGIYRSHAETIVAVSEIVRRFSQHDSQFDASSAEAITANFAHLTRAKQEHCYVLHIDKDQKATYQQLVGIGSTDSLTISASDILRYPLWLGANEIIIIHNHTSGNPDPSAADIAWTTYLAHGAWELHNIRIRDHIIISPNGYFSFSEQGLI